MSDALVSAAIRAGVCCCILQVQEVWGAKQHPEDADEGIPHWLVYIRRWQFSQSFINDLSNMITLLKSPQYKGQQRLKKNRSL